MERRVWRAGLAVSVLLHLLVFVWLYTTVINPTSAGSDGHRTRALPAPAGMQVVQIQPVAGAPAELTPEPGQAPATRPQQRRPIYGPSPTPGAAGPQAAGQARAGAAGPTGMDALRVHPGDERLYMDPDAVLPREKTDQERLEERIAGRVDQYNDSVAAAQEAARKALDWTVKGKNGERWGIAPDGIHLGKITLPAPSFGGNAESRARTREWSAIQDQASRAEIRDRFKDHVKAIRERKEKEHEEKKPGSSGSGSHGP